MLNSNSIDIKQRVAQQFGMAAARYDLLAGVQEEIAIDALELMVGQKSKVLLDIGCGTGRITQMLQQYSERVVGVDLAYGMITFAKSRPLTDNIEWIVGDVDNLPLQDNSVDSIFSSMALQWSSCAQQCFRELYRVCKTNGRIVLAIMTDGSLTELRSTWDLIDNEQQINQFYSGVTLYDVAVSSGFSAKITEKYYCTWHSSVNSVMHSIKDIGAGVAQSGMTKHRLNKSKLTALQDNYFRLHQQKGKLPLTYQVSFLELTK